MNKAVGLRYLLINGIAAEVYNGGTIILVAGDVQEFYDKRGAFNSTTDHHAKLWIELGRPADLRAYIQTRGRPYGTLWGE